MVTFIFKFELLDAFLSISYNNIKIQSHGHNYNISVRLHNLAYPRQRLELYPFNSIGNLTRIHTVLSEHTAMHFINIYMSLCYLCMYFINIYISLCYLCMHFINICISLCYLALYVHHDAQSCVSSRDDTKVKL